VWRDAAEKSHDEKILRPASNAFSADGGLKLLRGNLGRSVIKTSAVDPKYWHITAPARVFESQESLAAALKDGIEGDFIAVVRGQGPRANGMPELHKLIPALGVVQDRGHRIALVTDGRMSGASGKVPAAIHVSPEALPDGPLARLWDGDVVRVCGHDGQLEALGIDLAARDPAPAPPPPVGTGRELFSLMRHHVDGAEAGASAILSAMEAELR